MKNQNFELAILPWGAMEAHNYHLPYGTDNFETEKIAEESVREANKNEAKAIKLAIIPFGVNTGQTDIPLTINLLPSTQEKILEDVIRSVHQSGIRKFLLLNGHGGNDFKQVLRELGIKFPEMILITCNWFQSVDKTQIFENEGDHADEMETSLMMYIHPELVLPLNIAGEGKAKKFNIASLNENWAWSERKWTRITKDTGIGNPKFSTKGKGEIYLKAVVKKISRLILDLSLVKTENFFE